MLMSKKQKKASRRRARKREQRRDPWRWVPTLLALIRFGLWLLREHCR